MARKSKLVKPSKAKKLSGKNMPKDRNMSVVGDQKPGAMERREKRLAGKPL